MDQAVQGTVAPTASVGVPKPKIRSSRPSTKWTNSYSVGIILRRTLEIVKQYGTIQKGI